MKIIGNEDFLQLAYQYIKNNEGTRLNPYKDSEGILTIGIGHKILPGEDFSNGLTEEQVYDLFKKDIEVKIQVSKQLFLKFDVYPNYLKLALLDGVFRGDHKAKYKTTKLINDGNWQEASIEYLNRKDYIKSKMENTGIWKRLERNSEAMKQYGKEKMKYYENYRHRN